MTLILSVFQNFDHIIEDKKYCFYFYCFLSLYNISIIFTEVKKIMIVELIKVTLNKWLNDYMNVIAHMFYFHSDVSVSSILICVTYLLVEIIQTKKKGL